MRSLYMIFAALGLWATQAAASPEFWTHEWPHTDFTKTEVPWIEIISGGPGKDGIPALSDPDFVAAGDATIPDAEPALTLVVGGQAKAYPLRYLIWHELVNDHIADLPVLISFCPLCNSGVVFDRRIDGGVAQFGVTGKLRHSDMIMYDVATQSWWQQAIGRGIVGAMTGRDLIVVPSRIESVGDFRDRHPTGQIMAQPRYPRAYGQNPYVGYDQSIRPFLYTGELPPHDIPPLARVIRVGDRAWPMLRVQTERVIVEAGLRIEQRGTQVSALDAGVIAASRLIPTVHVTDANGDDIAHDVMFAFAFHAFFPQGTWMLAH